MRRTTMNPDRVEIREKGCIWCGDAECEQACARCGRCSECAGTMIDGECENCCCAD